MKVVATFVCICLAITCNAQTCDEFKTGHFRVKSSDGRNYSIQRTKDFQIETIKRKDFYFKITWTSECSYKLILDKRHKVRSMNDRKPIRIKMASDEETAGYNFTVSFDGRKYTPGGSVQKVGELIEEPENEIAKGY